MMLSNLTSSTARYLEPAKTRAHRPSFAVFTEVVVAPVGVIQRLFGSLIGSFSKADAIGVLGLTRTLIAFGTTGRANRFLISSGYSSVVFGSSTCVETI